MGFYLKRDGEVKRTYGITRWPQILQLARAYGWKTAGTTVDEGSGIILPTKWDGGYDSMDGQLVSAEDAANFADALEKSLSHFSRLDNERTLQFQIKTNTWSPPNEYQRSALHYFVKDENMVDAHRGSLIDLIELCREGEFRIH